MGKSTCRRSCSGATSTSCSTSATPSTSTTPCPTARCRSCPKRATCRGPTNPRCSGPWSSTGSTAVTRLLGTALLARDAVALQHHQSWYGIHPGKLRGRSERLYIGRREVDFVTSGDPLPSGGHVGALVARAQQSRYGFQKMRFYFSTVI